MREILGATPPHVLKRLHECVDTCTSDSLHSYVCICLYVYVFIDICTETLVHMDGRMERLYPERYALFSSQVPEAAGVLVATRPPISSAPIRTSIGVPARDGNAIVVPNWTTENRSGARTLDSEVQDKRCALVCGCA